MSNHAVQLQADVDFVNDRWISVGTGWAECSCGFRCSGPLDAVKPATRAHAG